MPRHTDTGSGIGVAYKPVVRRCVNRDGATVEKGDLVQLDMLNVSGAVQNYSFGDPDSAFSIIISAQAGSVNFVPIGIALERILDDREGDVLFEGVVEAKINGAVSVGGNLSPSVAVEIGTLVAPSGGGPPGRISGYALEANVSGTNLRKVLFEGNGTVGVVLNAS